MADCKNLKLAAETIGWSIYYNAGQTCNASSRVIVETSIKEELFSHLKDFAQNFIVGNPLDPNTQMGPIVSKAQRDRVNNYLDLIGQEGEQLICGGKKATGDDLFIQPTLVTRVSNQSRIAREEIFGPVLVAIEAKDDAEALAIENDTEYGLAASVWTDNVAKAHKFARKLRAGTLS